MREFGMKEKIKILLLVVVVLVLATAILAWAHVRRLQEDAMVLADRGRAAIAVLDELIAGVREADLDRVMVTYDEAYDNPSQGLWVEHLRSEIDGVRVYGWEMGELGAFGKAEMREQIELFLSGVESVQYGKFKLALVEELPDDDTMAVRATFWLRGVRSSGESFESKAPFRIWIRRVGDDWRIFRQELLSGETVTGDGVGFTNVTSEAGIDFEASKNPTFETSDWRLEKFNIAKYSSAGVTAGDYDGDGWHDIFFSNGGSARLYRNRQDGTFEDTTVTAGLPTDLLGVNVALLADFDNDGDQDLFLARFAAPNLLFRNEGDGSFRDVTPREGLSREIVAVATAGDYDLDGDLDIYLGRYLDPRVNLPTTIFYTRNGEGNTLLRNDGDLRFTDVTATAGVGEVGLALGVAWGDYDRDGDPDLYVANDFGRNALLRNGGDGTFTDVTVETGTGDLGYGMSVEFGDIDNDGDLDLYISTVHSGNRWYGQAPTLFNYILTSFEQGTLGEDLPLYREIYQHLGERWSSAGTYIIKGNSLLLNDGHGHFEDVAIAANANPFGWYWGSAMLDYDNDGLQDLYTVNGFISGKTTHDF